MKTADRFNTTLMNMQSNLLNYAYILTSDRNMAYRLLNETNALVIDNRRRFDGGKSVREGARAIMRLLYNKRYSRLVREVAVSERNYFGYTLHVDEDVPAESNPHLMAESRLHRAVNTLDSECADVYRMHLVGYTNSEIADRCGLSPTEVERRIAAGTRVALSA